MRMCARQLHEIPEGKNRCQKCQYASQAARYQAERAVISGELCPDWLDPVAVERALKGIPVGRPLTAAEKAEIARVVNEGGVLTYNAVAHILGLNGTAMKAMKTDRTTRRAS